MRSRIHELTLHRRALVIGLASSFGIHAALLFGPRFGNAGGVRFPEPSILGYGDGRGRVDKKTIGFSPMMCSNLFLLAIASVAACGDLAGVGSVSGRRPFDPPPVYLEWWSATEVCSGREGSFDRITWHLANGITGGGLVARGRWSSPHEIIIVAGYEHDEFVVRHEMLHDLLNGDRFHERDEWDDCRERRT